MGMLQADVADAVQAVLARFGKEHWHTRAISQMSQGQRQLVCLMAVLVMGPKVILLDEPFAGLDIPTSMHLSRILDGINASLVQITHDPACVAHYDHVVWVEGGRIRKQGQAGPVLDAFRRAMVHLGGADDFADLAS